MINANIFRAFAPVIAMVLALSFACSDDDPPVTPDPEYVTEEYVVRDIDFIKNQYFYFDNPYVVDISTVRPDQLSGVPIQIWREIKPWQKPDATIFWVPAFAFLDLDGRGSNLVAARDAYQNQLPRTDWPVHLPTDFQWLDEGQDYHLIFDPYGSKVMGFVLTRLVEDDRALAVSYVNTLGDTIGGSSWWKMPRGPDAVGRDTLFLELVKPKYPRPDNEFGFTWHYMMRNFYNLGVTEFTPETTELVIEDVLSVREDNTYPEGATPPVPYLRIFGLDQVDEAGDPNPDGVLDFVPQVINPDEGLMMFPAPTAFAPDSALVRTWTDSQFSFFPDYWPQFEKSERLYNEYLSNPVQDAYVYQIIIRVTRPK